MEQRSDVDHNVHLRLIQNLAEAKEELKRIVVDDVSIPMMAPKAVYLVMKIENLDVRAANIVKQEMLSKGGEAAVAKWSAGFSRPETDVLLMGTLKQYRLVLKKLKMQPFALPQLAAEIDSLLNNLKGKKRVLRCGPYSLPLGKRTLVMGILNVTPDSFSEEGLYFDKEKAIARAEEMVSEGADIIDIGGESTRPGSTPVSVEEEKKRVLPVIKALVNKLKVPISIDTRKAEVARQALELGATIVNDISGLRGDSQMAKVVSAYEVPVIIMHMKGEPRTMQENPVYEEVMAEIMVYLRESAVLALKKGVKKENIIIDPGIGFGKTAQHNLEILRRLEELKSLGYPILVGTSRKSTIGQVLDLPVGERLEGTAATVAISIFKGVDIVRVHDVKPMIRVARMADAIKKGLAWHG